MFVLAVNNYFFAQNEKVLMIGTFQVEVLNIARLITYYYAGIDAE